MKPFIPAVSFALVNFLLLAAMNEVIETEPELSKWLYFASAASWLIALAIPALLFISALRQHRLHFFGSIVFAVVAIIIYYPCFGYLAAHAEQHVANQRIAAGWNPVLAFDAMYHNTSGEGAARAMGSALDMFKQGVCLYIIFWLPVVLVTARLVYRRSIPKANTSNA